MIKSKLYNTDIDSLLRSLDLAHFKGVYSADNIPHFENTDFIFICNLSNEGEVGTHFVTIGKLGNMILYLDSLALNCMNIHLIRYLGDLVTKSSKLYSITTAIQPLLSQGCGIYCIFFVLLYHAAATESLEANLLPFSKGINKKYNDDTCAKNIFIFLRHLNREL